MHGSGERIRVLHVNDEPDFADMAGTFLERERTRRKAPVHREGTK